jgi:ribonuclease HII
VARSVWQVPAGTGEEKLTALLADRFQAKKWARGSDKIPLGDSKQLYQSGGSLRVLEAGLLAMLSQLKTLPTNFCEFQKEWELPSVNRNGSASSVAMPWYQDAALELLPVPQPGSAVPDDASAWREELHRLARLVQSELDSLDIRLIDLRVVVVREPQFNHLLEKTGSKAHVLAEATMQLVLDALASWPDACLYVYCDRHGGRKDYLPMLMNYMPDEWFVQLRADELRSSYRRQRSPDFEIHFSVKGDSFPPTALASMLAKYCRERYMQAFNAFWQRQLPQLQPTAGYPVDALRYREQILQLAQQLRLSPSDWWRNK